jgi:hypothetical protein
MQNLPLTFDELFNRFSNGQIAFDDKVVFFTRQDRNRQTQDSSSEGCTVIDTSRGTQLGVLHIHLELGQRQPGAVLEDVITKAHVKDFHDGRKLFDLNLRDNRAAMIIQRAYGGSYSIYI